jgi:hypothetical protein
MLEWEFKYFIDHQSELVNKFNGKYIVIKGNKVLGSYDSKDEALVETLKDHPAGTFLVQLCIPGEEVYTQQFYSRVLL